MERSLADYYPWDHKELDMIEHTQTQIEHWAYKDEEKHILYPHGLYYILVETDTQCCVITVLKGAYKRFSS